MELKQKLLVIIILIFLLLDVSESRFRHRKKHRRNFRSRTRRIVQITRPTTSTKTTTTRPLTLSHTVPQEKCRVIVDKLPKKRHPGPICLRLSEAQKLARLREVGGYNPRYVAINREHAQKFVDLTGDQLPLPTNASSSVQQDNSANNQENGSFPTESETNVRSKRMADDSEPSTEIRACREAGDPVENGFRSLCTECSAVTTLPANVFPPFINEVICGGDRCFQGIGFCQQEVIRFIFLRSTGEFEQDDDDEDVFVEQLDTFQQDIGACCQCRVFPFIRFG